MLKEIKRIYNKSILKNELHRVNATRHLPYYHVFEGVLDYYGKVVPAKERLLKSEKKWKDGEIRGKIVVIFCAVIMIAVAISITIFLATKGLQSFIKDGVSPIEFLTSKTLESNKSSRSKIWGITIYFWLICSNFSFGHYCCTIRNWRRDFYD